jgi:hypothetical protein
MFSAHTVFAVTWMYGRREEEDKNVARKTLCRGLAFNYSNVNPAGVLLRETEILCSCGETGNVNLQLVYN